jgi:hypothetical protein
LERANPDARYLKLAARLVEAGRARLAGLSRLATSASLLRSSTEPNKALCIDLFALVEAHLQSDPTWPDAERFLDYPDQVATTGEATGMHFQTTMSWWPEGMDLPDDCQWWPDDREPSYQHGVPYMDEPAELRIHLDAGGAIAGYALRFGMGKTARLFRIEAPN